MSRVILHTNHGDITLALDAENAPATVANFLQYVRDGHYDDTVFHRVIDGFMIQGGGFAPGMRQKPTRASVANEAVATSNAGMHQNVPREDVVITRAEEITE